MRTLLIVGVLLAALLLPACGKTTERLLPTSTIEPTQVLTPTPDAAAVVLHQLAAPELDLSAALAAVVGDVTNLDSVLADLESLERLALQEDVPTVPDF